MRFMRRSSVAVNFRQRSPPPLGVDQLMHLLEEPGIDPGELVNLGDSETG